MSRTTDAIGIDVGLTCTGIALLRNERVAGFDTASSTDTKLHIGTRCILLAQEIIDKINKILTDKKVKFHEINIFVLEQCFLRRSIRGQNVKGFAKQNRLIQQVYSVIDDELTKHVMYHIGGCDFSHTTELRSPCIIEVAPASIKKIFNKAHGAKTDLRPRILKTLQFPNSFHELKSGVKQEAIIDAAAIAYYGVRHLRQSKEVCS